MMVLTSILLFVAFLFLFTFSLALMDYGFDLCLLLHKWKITKTSIAHGVDRLGRQYPGVTMKYIQFQCNRCGKVKVSSYQWGNGNGK